MHRVVRYLKGTLRLVYNFVWQDERALDVIVDTDFADVKEVDLKLIELALRNGGKIVTNDFNSPPMVLISSLNERHPGLRYLAVQLRGTRSNRDGLGATVEVTLRDRVLTQVHDGQSGYLSQSSLPLYFGLGDALKVDKITVRWPDGASQTVNGPIDTNQNLLIVEE